MVYTPSAPPNFGLFTFWTGSPKAIHAVTEATLTSPSSKQITLPITGMTCAMCVAAVERNVKKVDGVDSVMVNLSSERASLAYDPSVANLGLILERIERAGYGVATGAADLIIQRMSDNNDARRLEKALSDVEGVLEATVSFTTERARIQYIPTLVSQADLRRAVLAAGFKAVETGGEAEDAERLAREAEIAGQKRLLITGLAFTIPLFLLSMARDSSALEILASLGVEGYVEPDENLYEGVFAIVPKNLAP